MLNSFWDISIEYQLQTILVLANVHICDFKAVI